METFAFRFSQQRRHRRRQRCLFSRIFIFLRNDLRILRTVQVNSQLGKTLISPVIIKTKNCLFKTLRKYMSKRNGEEKKIYRKQLLPISQSTNDFSAFHSKIFTRRVSGRKQTKKCASNLPLSYIFAIFV